MPGVVSGIACPSTAGAECRFAREAIARLRSLLLRRRVRSDHPPFLRLLLRRAAAETQDGGRHDALASLASLAEHDVHVDRVLHEIEMKDRFHSLRVLARD